MPDLERFTDILAKNLAETPEERAYVAGYIAGKSHARKEILRLVIFVAFGWVLGELLWPWILGN